MVAVLIAVAVVTVVAMFGPDPDVEGLGVRNRLGIGPAHAGNGWHFLLFGPVLVLAFGAGPAGRPSRIAVSVCGQRVRVGGSGLVVAEGTLTV